MFGAASAESGGMGGFGPPATGVVYFSKVDP
jgi:hypothetical protein